MPTEASISFLLEAKDMITPVVSGIKSSLDELNTALMMFQDTMSNINDQVGKTLKTLKDNKNAVDNSKNALTALNKELKSQAQVKFGEAMRRVGDIVGQTGEVFNKQIIAVTKLTSMIDKGFRAAVSAGDEMANSLINVGKQVHLTSDQSNVLRDRMQDVGLQFARMPGELENLFAIALKSGLDVTNGMEEFASQTIKFADVVGMSTDAVAVLNSKMMRFLDATIGDLKDLNQSMLVVVKSTRLAAEEVANLMNQILPITDMVADAMEEKVAGSLLRVAGIAEDMAVDPGDVVSTFRTLIDNLSGESLRLQAFIESQTGQRVDELIANKDYVSVFRELQRAAVSLRDSYADMGESGLSLFNREIGVLSRNYGISEDLLLRLSNTTTSAFEESLQQLTATEEKVGDLNKLWEDTRQSLSKQWDELIVAGRTLIQEVGIPIMKLLLPVLRDVTTWVGSWVEWYRQLSPEAKAVAGTVLTLTGGLIALGAAAVAVSSAFSLVYGGLSGIVTMVATVASAISTTLIPFLLTLGQTVLPILTTAVGFLGKALMFLAMNPIGIVITLVGVLLLALSQFEGGLGGALQKIGEFLWDVGKAVLDFILNIPGKIGMALLGLTDILTPFFTLLSGTFIGQIGLAITNLLKMVGSFLAQSGKTFLGVIINGFISVLNAQLIWPVNALLDGISWVLRNISGGMIDIPATLRIPQIPHVALAKGGIVTQETIARIGEGNRPEVVIPLDRLPEVVQATTPFMQPSPQVISVDIPRVERVTERAAEATQAGTDRVEEKLEEILVVLRQAMSTVSRNDRRGRLSDAAINYGAT